MTILQQELKRQLEEFDRRWQDPMEKKHGDGFKLFCSFCQGEWREEIKDYFLSCQQKTLEKVKEICEEMKLEAIHESYCDVVRMISDDCSCNYEARTIHNGVLNDILSELNKQ